MTLRTGGLRGRGIFEGGHEENSEEAKYEEARQKQKREEKEDKLLKGGDRKKGADGKGTVTIGRLNIASNSGEIKTFGKPFQARMA